MNLLPEPLAAGWQHRSQGGFSLLELLAVLVVVVLLTSLVSFNVGTGGEDLRLDNTVRQIADTAEFALDEAQFSGRDYGLRIERVTDAGELQFRIDWMERLIDGWAPPRSESEVFDPLALPPGVELELEIENAPFSEVDVDEEGEALRNPQVVFYASGETTVGAMNLRRLSDGELLWRIEWDLLGRFDLLRRGIRDDEVFE